MKIIRRIEKYRGKRKWPVRKQKVKKKKTYEKRTQNYKV